MKRFWALCLALLWTSGCSILREETIIDTAVPGTMGREAAVASAKRYVHNLYFPVSKIKPRLTSRFGWRGGRFHEGLDLAAPEGSTIVAAHDGDVVMCRDRFSHYGRVLVVRNGSFLTVYAHNSKNLVDKGDRVKKGQSIAEVGSTGNASGPHLHFETRVKNKQGKYVAVDPEFFLQARTG